jgi:hypothetical protein
VRELRAELMLGRLVIDAERLRQIIREELG